MPQVGGRHIPLLSAFVPMNNIHVQPLPQLLPQRPPQPAPPRAIDRAAEIQYLQQQQQLRKEQRRATRQAIIDKWEPRLAEERQRCESWIPTVPKSHPTADHCLGVQIERFWQESRPSQGHAALRKAVVDDLQSFFDNAYTGNGLKVAAFGSSVTGLYDEASDVDLVVLDPGRPLGVGTPPHHVLPYGPPVPHIEGLPEWYSIRAVTKKMRAYNHERRSLLWKNLVVIANANVPIIKLEVEHIRSGRTVAVDITINNRFGLTNSQLIKAYADLQPLIFRPLAYFIKHWLKRRGLNDPAGTSGLNSLSSYSIVLLIIQYLQIKKELPNLQYWGLISCLEVPSRVQYQAPKLPRRRVGDPRSGTAEDTRKPVAAECDVTFFDPDNRHASEVATSVAQTSEDRIDRRAWFNRYDGVSKDIDLAEWELDPGQGAQWGCPPTLEDAGFHKPRRECCEGCTPKSLGDLFRGFVDWFCDLHLQKTVISISQGYLVPLSVKYIAQAGEDGQPLDEEEKTVDMMSTLSINGDHPAEWLAARIIIQDPFIKDRNTAKNVGKIAADQLHDEFVRAQEMIGYSCGDCRLTGEDEESHYLYLDEIMLPVEYERALKESASEAEGSGSAAGGSTSGRDKSKRKKKKSRKPMHKKKESTSTSTSTS